MECLDFFANTINIANMYTNTLVIKGNYNVGKTSFVKYLTLNLL